MPYCAEKKKGSSYEVLRETNGSMSLLRPDKELMNIVLYSIGYACLLHGTILHYIGCVNDGIRYHLTDPKARLPKVLAWAHRMIARLGNLFWGRKGSFFENTGHHTTRVASVQAMIEAIVETMTMPYELRLVRDPSKSPGIWFGPDDVMVKENGKWVGVQIKVPRPDGVSDGFPAWVVITLRPPLGIDPEMYLKLLREGYEKRMAMLRLKARREGWLFLGAKKAEKRSWRTMSRVNTVWRAPRFRVARGDTGAWSEAWKRDREFVKAQHRARRLWIGGERGVEFPAGTYWLRVHFLVRCAASGAGPYP